LAYDYKEDLHKNLSDREFEIFKQIVSGKNITEIAARTFCKQKCSKRQPQQDIGEDAPANNY
jgi:DNA-binding NarL/FixJ family response regulator